MGTTTYDVGNPGPSWDRHKSVTVFNRLMNFQISSLSLDKFISNGNTYINKR